LTGIVWHMSWLLYALLSLVSFSVYDVLSRVAGIQAKNPRAYSALYALLVSLLALPLFWWEPPVMPELTVEVVGLTLLSWVAWTVFVRYEYYAHKEMEATSLVLLLKLAPVVAFVLAVTVLGEAITWMKTIGMTTIALAGLLVIWAETGGKWRSTRGLRYALVVVMSLAAGWTFDKVVAPWYGPVLYTIFSFGPPAVINSLLPPVGWRAMMKELQLAGWRIYVLAMLSVAGYYGLIKALTLGEASRVIPVATSTTPLVVLLAAVFLKERSHLKVKLGAMLLTVVGIILLG
jgi:drug/metabolite transporter (DMT)-like permease